VDGSTKMPAARIVLRDYPDAPATTVELSGVAAGITAWVLNHQAELATLDAGQFQADWSRSRGSVSFRLTTYSVATLKS